MDVDSEENAGFLCRSSPGVILEKIVLIFFSCRVRLTPRWYLVFMAEEDGKSSPGGPSVRTGPESDFGRLLCRARSGCAASLNELIRSCQDYLLLVANEQLESGIRRRVSPSDVVQGALALATDRIDQFRGDSREEWIGWLRAILQNEMLGTARRHRTQKRDAGREIESPSVAMASLPDGGETPGTAAIRAEEAKALREAMLRLSPHHRQVILLRSWRELSFAEVAKQLGRSEDAARKLWCRAIERLEKELSGERARSGR